MKLLPIFAIFTISILLMPANLFAESTTWHFGYHSVDQFAGFVRTGGPDYYGTMPTQTGTGEVVVEFHVATDGFVVPLPVYPSDSETADFSEIFWMISPGGATLYTPMEPGSITADFAGTTLSLNENEAMAGFTLRIVVVAVRQQGIPRTEESNWGSVKRMFR